MCNHIPFILLTAKSDSDSRVRGFEVGANDFLTKPFDEQQLRHRIANQLTHVRNVRRANSEAQRAQVNPVADALITRFLCVVEQHFGDADMSIKELCDKLHVSARQLERKVQHFIDMTPNEYLNEYRLLRARDMLKAGHLIKTVHEACGFSSPSYFARRYRQRFGQAPSAEHTETTTSS